MMRCMMLVLLGLIWRPSDCFYPNSGNNADAVPDKGDF